MTAYLKQAPIGFPGDITRVDVSNVEPVMLVSPLPTVFGFPLVANSGGASAWGGGNVATDFKGVLVREVPQIAGDSASDASLNATPNSKQANGMLVRGYIVVACPYGTPAREGVVYVRTVANGNGAVGDFNATSDSTNSVALTATQAAWATDGKDASGYAELRIGR
jgi:hypothetical protein